MALVARDSDAAMTCSDGECSHVENGNVSPWILFTLQKSPHLAAWVPLLL